MPAKKASKPATQNDLKRAVYGLDRRIDGLDRRIDGLDRRIDGLDRKIDENAKRLAVEIVNTNDRITNLDASLREEMTRNTDKILTALDRHAQTSEANNRAIVLHGHALSENAQTLSDHERRITALEPEA